METEVHESTVRRRAAKLGYRIEKSKQRKHVPNLDNHGEYMLIENQRNFVVFGERYDATLEEINDWLTD
jgi:hypothetical protein